MKYQMSQLELKEAIQFYLNERVLKQRITVSTVEPRDMPGKLGINYVLHVDVFDDQEHLSGEDDAAS